MATNDPSANGSNGAAAHCPHCGAALPVPEDPPTSEPASDAVFCPSCGRRVEGWRTGLRAALGGAAAGVPLPGGDEPTRAVAPSESLLRAVALSKQEAAQARGAAPAEGDSGVGLEPVRKRRGALWASALALVLIVGLGIGVAMRRPIAPPAQQVAAPSSVAPDPAQPVATPTPSAPAKKSGKPRRIAAPPIAAPDSTAAAAPTPKSTPAGGKTTAPPTVAHGGSNLPHKAAKTDSKGADAATQSSGTAAPPNAELPMAANETVENEATPMTEAERRSEAAARADADSVRFVVRARLPQVHACYTRVFKESSPGGRVDIGFLIGGNGRATKIHTESNSTGSAALSTCLEQRIAEWEFPRPASGTFELIYPFVFSPGT